VVERPCLYENRVTEIRCENVRMFSQNNIWAAGETLTFPTNDPPRTMPTHEVPKVRSPQPETVRRDGTSWCRRPRTGTYKSDVLEKKKKHIMVAVARM